MAEMVDIPTNVMVAAGAVGTAVTGAIGWLFRAKQAELDKANARIVELQDKLVSMMQSQLEAEPARKETLAAIARAIEGNTTLIKERLRT